MRDTLSSFTRVNNMKKSGRIIIVITVVVALPIAYWLISPLFITKQVNEKLEDIMPPQAAITEKRLAQGVFTGLAGHSATGTVTLYQFGNNYILRLEDDFMVTNGPDLFVHFGKDGAYVKEARLAALKGNLGGQNYEVPADINPSDYDEVWIWCRSFAVPFGKAVLQ